MRQNVGRWIIAKIRYRRGVSCWGPMSCVLVERRRVRYLATCGRKDIVYLTRAETRCAFGVVACLFAQPIGFNLGSSAAASLDRYHENWRNARTLIICVHYPRPPPRDTIEAALTTNQPPSHRKQNIRPARDNVRSRQTFLPSARFLFVLFFHFLLQTLETIFELNILWLWLSWHHH